MKLGEIARVMSGKVTGDPDVEIRGVRDLSAAVEGDLSFVQSARYRDAAEASKFAFIRVLAHFLPAPPRAQGVHPKAVVASGAKLGKEVTVGPGAVVEAGAVVGPGSIVGAGTVVEAGCEVGADVVLHPNVTLYRGSVVGDRSIIHAGSVLGADGFGYVQEEKPGEADAGGAIDRYMQVEGPHAKVPQLGNVVVGEDVEIGASVTVDRGTLGSTVIGRGTKIDNQVQIGHNCRIGEDVIIIAEVGIGGSAVVGNHVTIGGNCGISEGVDIGDFCIVGAHTLMFPGKKFPPRTVILGNPARTASKTREQMLALSTLPRVVQKLRRLEGRIASLEKGNPG
ncbi:MAG: UDP-3-O-(3-hydroxymyristoyl)glucosamine N-acyltransferase [Planctomycetota bacterium]|jgi:UDP-3-O-[3-hydroxymyristoyl] glucosamine N-acyltransferase